MQQDDLRFLLRQLADVQRRLERLEVQERGEATWAFWTPKVTGWADGYTCVARRYVAGKICFWEAYITGTSNSSTTTITAPFVGANINASFSWGGACATIVDNGIASATGGRWTIANDSSTIVFSKDFADGAFSVGGTKTVRAQGFYEIA